jgi:hypothetical protein
MDFNDASTAEGLTLSAEKAGVNLTNLKNVYEHLRENIYF